MKAFDYRRRAREALRGKWWYVVGTLLTMNFITGIITRILLGFIQPVLVRMQYSVGGVGTEVRVFIIVALFSLALALLQIVITVGQYRIAGDVLDGGMPYLARLFPMGQFGTILGMNLLRILKTLLWELPGLVLMVIGYFVDQGGEWLMIAGYIAGLVCAVIAVYRYIMADYLLADFPSMGARESLRESARRMKGFKWKYFCLQFSFIGWSLLAALVGVGLSSLVLASGSTTMNMVVSLITSIIQSMLNAYTLVASVAFFRDTPRDRDAQRASIWDDVPPEDKTAPDAEPEVAPVDYTAAMNLFYSYQCSWRRMRRADCLAEYDAMGVPASVEEDWRQKYGRALMRRFEGDATALGGLMELISEYAMEDLTSAVLDRIDRHLRDHSLPAQEVLPMCGRVMALLCAGAFAEDEAFAQRKRAQILAMVDRMEQQLEREQPEGDWRGEIQKIRNM